MKKTVYITLIVALSVLLGAEGLFYDNPAGYAHRTGWEMNIPFVSGQFNFSNSSLSLNDLSMFEEGHVLTDSEKKKLVDDDLLTNIHFAMEPLSFGMQNWQFRQRVHLMAHANLLKKEFSRIVFYGNEIDTLYSVNALEGSKALAFTKSSLAWSYPQDIALDGLLDAVHADSTLSFLRGLSLNLGAQMNVYYGAAYGEVLESSQDFGSFPDSNFYDVNMRYGYTDDQSDGGVTAGFGLGMQLNLPRGAFHFYMDDIFFSQMTFNDLAGGEYQAHYVDSLLYLQEDFEPFDESNENDSLRIAKRKVRVSPTMIWGLEYDVYQGINVLARIQRSDYLANDGLSVGAKYIVNNWWPVGFRFGGSESTFYEFTSGVQSNRFIWDVGVTWYDGLFNGARGIGWKSLMTLRF